MSGRRRRGPTPEITELSPWQPGSGLSWTALVVAVLASHIAPPLVKLGREAIQLWEAALDAVSIAALEVPEILEKTGVVLFAGSACLLSAALLVECVIGALERRGSSTQAPMAGLPPPAGAGAPVAPLAAGSFALVRRANEWDEVLLGCP